MTSLRRSWPRWFLAGLIGATAPVPLAQAADERPAASDAEAAIRLSQAAVGRQIADYTFRRPDGSVVRLAEYRDKPLVLNLVYTGCADVCPLVIRTLYRAVDVAQQALDPDSFMVLTIGFDTAHDTPERMRAFARRQGADLPNWQFLSAEPEEIERLAGDLGFIFYPSVKGFDHLAQTTIVEAGGRIYRQVYGASFEAPALVEPLKDLVFRRDGPIGGFSDIIDRIRLFCTVYDPASDRYRFDYSIFIGLVGGLATLGTVGTILVRALIQMRRRDAAKGIR